MAMRATPKRERLLNFLELPCLILAGILVPLALWGDYAWWQTPGDPCDLSQVTKIDLYKKTDVAKGAGCIGHAVGDEGRVLVVVV